MKNLILFLFVFIFACVKSFSQGGSSCTSALANPITLGNTYTGQTTCGTANNYTGTGACLSATSYAGNEWYYYFCATQAGYLSIEMTNASSGTAGQTVNPTMTIFKGCPGTGTCVSGNTALIAASTTANGPWLSTSVVAGQCYYVLVDEIVSGNSPCVNFTFGTKFTPKVTQASCTNMEFENGLTGWSPNYGTVSTGATNAIIPAYSIAGMGVRPTTPRHTITTGGTDACGGFNQVFSGSSSLKLGDNLTGNLGEQISQTFKVSKSNASFTYNYAVVLEDPQHPNNQQPFFTAILFDQKGDTIPCSSYIVTAGANVKGFLTSTTCFGVQYKPWSSVNVDLTPYIGQDVTAEFTVGDCTQGGHYGYAYLDIKCAPSLLEAQNDTICAGQSTTLLSPAGYASYLWNPGGATTQNITVSPTTMTIYTVVLTSFNGCTQTYMDTVWVEPSINVQATSVNAGCGNCNGSAIATPQTGSAPYAYLWSNGVSVNSTSGLCPSTYSVTVTASNGCTASTSAVITGGGGLNLTIAPTNATCKGLCNGKADVTILGGVSPFTYLWNNAQTLATATGLCVGTYTVTVKDVNGCSATQTASITEPTAVTATDATTNVLCKGGTTGGSTITAAGGTSPYAFAWSSPISSQTTAVVTNLSAGNYIVTISDANGCTTSTSINVTEPPPITINPTTTNTACGASNGTASVAVGGGTGPYAYAWSPPAIGTSSAINNLAAGGYTVTVTDANSCTNTLVLTINNIPTASVTASGTTVSCNGGNDGTANVTVGSTGNPPFTYSWSPAVGGQTTASITGLTAGIYTAFVTDGSGCLSSDTVLIKEPTLLVVTAAKTDLKCFGDKDGNVTTTSNGATQPYFYAWCPLAGAQTTASATSLVAGNYTVTVTDAKGCNTTQSATITEPLTLVIIPSNTNELCAGGNTANATVTVSGGTSGYTYLWSAPGGQTTASINGLIAGTYTCAVTDANACPLSQTITITEPTPITTSSSFTQATCNTANGSATVNPNGGTSPYAYLWDVSAGSQITSTASALTKGTYTCTITDANGCTISATVIVPESGVPTAAASGTNVLCFGGNDGTATVTVNNGVSPFSYLWSNLGTSATVNGLTPGNYSVTVTDVNACSATATVIISEPTAVTLTTSPQATICLGQSTTLTATGAGGTPGYSYNWDNGSSLIASYTVQPVLTQIYSVTVVDANNCSTSKTITVIVGTPLNVVALKPDSVCPGDSKPISAQASGGSGVYNYAWAPAGGNAQNTTVTPSTTTTYTVTVTDDCGTPATTATVTIVVMPLPIVLFTGDDTTGCAPLCVNFTNLSPNSTTCFWTFGEPGASSNNCNARHCYNTPGKFSVSLTVVDNKGCQNSSTHLNMVDVYPIPVAEFTATPNTGTIINPKFEFNNQSRGSVSWIWDFGDQMDSKLSTLQHPTHSYPDIGSYCILLTATNMQGCQDTITHCVKVGPEFTFFVPNAFSPNGDGKNETFYGKGIGIVKYRMIIVDRWGDVIFETDDINIGWNGKANKGEDLAQQDVYSYKIYLTDVFDKSHQYLGHVSLVR